MWELLQANAIVLVASAMQACTGFGFSVLATPFLLLVYDGAAAIQINIILSILISLRLAPRLARDVDRGLVGRMIAGGAVGALAGAPLYVLGDAEALKLAIGLLLLGLTAAILALPAIDQTSLRDRATGAISGALTSGLGMPGPPLMVYFAGARMDKAALRGATLTYFLFIYAFALALQIATASTTTLIWTHAAALVPATLLGAQLGDRLFRRIDQRLFMRAIQAILVATGAALVVSAL